MRSHTKNIKIHYIGYVTIKDFDHTNIHSVNPLYLTFNEVGGYIRENNRNFYNFYFLLLQIKTKNCVKLHRTLG